MSERLAETLIVVVTCNGEDRSPASEKGFKRRLEMPNRLAQSFRPRQFAKQVAGNQQDIDPTLLAIARDLLNRTPKIARPIDPAQTIREMPIRCMQQLHVGVFSRCTERKVEVSRASHRRINAVCVPNANICG